MRPSIIVITLLAAAFSAAASAQMYKWVDKDGRISYSDTPPPKEAKDVKQKNFGDGVGSGASPDDLPPMVREAIKNNPVTLYANNCGEACDGGRAMLTKRGILFTERNPETDKAGYDALMKLTGGQQTVPVLSVGSKVLKGFAEGEWQEALTSAGYPRFNPGVKAKPAAPAAPATPSAPGK